MSGRPAIRPSSAGSTRIRSAPSLLRALRIAVTSLAARTSAGPSPRGLRSSQPMHRLLRTRAAADLDRTRGSRHRPAAGPARRTRPASSARPLDGDHLRTAGGKPASARSASSRAANPPGPPGPGPAAPGWSSPRPRSPIRRRRPAGPARRRSASAAGPPRRRADPAGAATARCPAARPRRSRRRPAARRPAWRPPGPAWSGTESAACAADRLAYRGLGEGLAQLLGRPLRADDGSPNPTASRRSGTPSRPGAGRTSRSSWWPRPSAARTGPSQNRQRAGSRQSWQTRATR